MINTSSRTVIQGGTSMTRDVLGDGYNKFASSMASYGASGGYFNDNKNNSGKSLDEGIDLLEKELSKDNDTEQSN